MFYRSRHRREQAHVIEAFTFELGKCYEQAIKERELEVLAKVDADLCSRWRPGSDCPHRTASRRESFNRPRCRKLSTSQVDRPAARSASSPTPGADLAGVAKLVQSLQRLGATPLVIAPAGGVLKTAGAPPLWSGRC